MRKEILMNFRIEKDLKEKFMEINKRRLCNSSMLLRKWIEDYVEENQIKGEWKNEKMNKEK